MCQTRANAAILVETSENNRWGRVWQSTVKFGSQFKQTCSSLPISEQNQPFQPILNTHRVCTGTIEAQFNFFENFNLGVNINNLFFHKLWIFGYS